MCEIHFTLSGMNYVIELWRSKKISLLLFNVIEVAQWLNCYCSLELGVWFGENKIDIFLLLISLLVTRNLSMSVLYFVLWKYLNFLDMSMYLQGNNRIHLEEKIYSIFLNTWNLFQFKSYMKFAHKMEKMTE